MMITNNNINDHLGNSIMLDVENYIWSNAGNDEFLCKIVTDHSFDLGKLLIRVEAIQRNLNIQLRKEVCIISLFAQIGSVLG